MPPGEQDVIGKERHKSPQPAAAVCLGKSARDQWLREVPPRDLPRGAGLRAQAGFVPSPFLIVLVEPFECGARPSNGNRPCAGLGWRRLGLALARCLRLAPACCLGWRPA
ncbi:hypothetical protein FKM82_019155 [Ascaphus truei]